MNFEITDKSEGRKVEVTPIKEENGILFVEVCAVQKEASIPEPFSVKWGFPSSGCYSVWTPADSEKSNIAPEWAPIKTSSRLAMMMPLESVLSIDGRNKMTVAVSDAITSLTVSAGVREEDANIYFAVQFFTIPVAPLKEYSAILRIDTRDIPYYDSIYDCVCWWEQECGYIPAPVPEHAKLPMNSLWYSYHQRLDCEDILNECKLSKKLGMETVIIDDGWQTDDNNRGYSYCGDWKVAQKKIPDMREFVDKIHETGMKVILWYSVPFVGIYAKNYERFKDMFLKSTGTDKQVWILDPRYKEVRTFLVEQYKNALINWNLDGLKLDFIDSFCLPEDDEYDERRDFVSLEDGIDALMTEVTDELRRINPEVLIEFRQSYVGPAIRKYGNMLRVRDCPNDSMVNRSNIVDLRLTSGNTAVHSDMFMWNAGDTVESAAVQLASSLYAVPQVSMKLASLPESHLKMLEFYLKFWRENQDTLMNGKITAKNPEIGYSLVCASKDGKAVYTAYTNSVIESNGEKETAIVNVTAEKSLVLSGFEGASYRVLSCMGDTLESGTVTSDLKKIDVPLCGIIFTEKK